MNKDIVISCNNITKIYPMYQNPKDRFKEALHPFRKKYHTEFYALNDVSFDVKKGETVGIIGKNGAGKSTLLKIITGVLTPTSGLVDVRGKVASLLELGAGFNMDMTGIDNIYLNGTIMGFSKEEIDKKIDQIMAFADIGEHIYQPVKGYSSGMFARLAFAVAINVEPDILIVDEALSVGDMAFQSKCFNKFREFSKKGITILFVTHSTDLIIKYCQSAILLDAGIKTKEGNSKETVEVFRKIMVNASIETTNKTKNIMDKTSSSEILPLLKDQLILNKNPIEYGDKQAEIIDFAIINQQGEITNQIYHNEDYIIQISVKFNKKTIDPIIAYTIKSVDGLELTGTNTMNLDYSFSTPNKNEVITVKFNQNMILNAGNYLLSLGCTKFGPDGLIAFHRLYDITNIEVLSTVTATGMAFSVSNLEVIRRQD